MGVFHHRHGRAVVLSALWRRVAGEGRVGLRSRPADAAARGGCRGRRTAGRGGRGAGNRATAWGARYRGQSRVGSDPGFWLFPACHPVCGRIEYRSGSKGAWAVWMFPALALCMLGGHISLACIVLRILPGKKRPRRDPTSEIRWPLFCFGLCFAISGSFFIAAYLAAAVPQGQPWSPCLFAVPHVAIGVAFAISAVRKPSKDAPEGDALPRTCPRCEATVPAGERICPRCGKRVRAGKAKAGT